MVRRLSVLGLTLFFLISCACVGLCDVPAPKSKNKQTVVGLYVDAKGAYKMVTEKKAVLIDVRTPEEFQVIGNTGLAPNIPYKLFTRKWSDKKSKFNKALNPRFVDAVKAKFKPDQTLLIICRSGSRSAAGANDLAKAGYKQVYNVVDGFEGGKLKDGPNKGWRLKDGWKNAKLPWTYKMKKENAWMPE